LGLGTDLAGIYDKKNGAHRGGYARAWYGGGLIGIRKQNVSGEVELCFLAICIYPPSISCWLSFLEFLLHLLHFAFKDRMPLRYTSSCFGVDEFYGIHDGDDDHDLTIVS